MGRKDIVMTAEISPVRVTCAGTGDAFGSGGRLQACFHVAAQRQRFLIDCGSSVLSGLKRYGLNPAEIDTVIVSHLHGDHFGGIPYLLLDGKYGMKRRKTLTIAGPPGLQEAVCALSELLYPGTLRENLGFDVHYRILEDQATLNINDMSVSGIKVLHGGSDKAFGLRLQIDGKIIAYTGDTEWTEALVPLASGADLLIAECCSFDETLPSHLNYSLLERQRSRLGCRRLVLTHMGSDMLTKVPCLNMETLADGDILDL